MLATIAPWLALVTTTLVFVVALRSRWKRTPVLVRCVCFSLYAHFFLATIAYTTNFMGWDARTFGPGRGTREVRVRMTSDATSAEAQPLDEPMDEADEVPPWEPTGEVPVELATAASLTITKQDSSATASAKPDVPAPALPDLPPLDLPKKAPQRSPLESVAEVLAEVAPRYADAVQATTPAPLPEHGRVDKKSDAFDPPRVPGAAASSAPSMRPDVYHLRFADDRASVVESAGGSLDTEAAVKRSLEWLVANQEADGRWSAARHGAGRGAPQHNQERGDTGVDADTGITGLALLALLGAGHTHLEGEHRVAVQRGLEFLLASQRADGCLAGNAKLFASMYCHGMATLAVAEAMAISRDARLKSGVERAVAYTVAAQHSAGGWRYQPHDVGDMSQFGWQIMALKSAELAGVKTPDVTKQRARRFLAMMSSGRNGGLASYRAGERPSRTMTAEALLCRYLLEESAPAATRDEATAFLLQELPSSGAPNVYYWYYGTLAMRLSGGASSSAGWQRWNESLQAELLNSQRFEGRLTGSWDPDRVWGGYGGRVYQTALAALCLESYYRYDTAAIERRTLR